MEEGLFPHKMSMEEPGRLEEERRLAYVGVTRAMQRLVLTYAETRRLYGSETYNKVSRFVREIPASLVREVRLGNTVSRPMAGSAPRTPSMFSGAEVPETGFTLGQRVQHALFRRGHHPQLRRRRRPGAGAGEVRERRQQVADAGLREAAAALRPVWPGGSGLPFRRSLPWLYLLDPPGAPCLSFPEGYANPWLLSSPFPQWAIHERHAAAPA